MQEPFDTAIDDSGEALVGPLRSPRQMLASQEYDSHASIHDDATAKKLGFKGGTIEGPTHFSQFAPLCVAAWGVRWFEQGSLSIHYRAACFEGDEVRAFLAKPNPGQTQTAVWMVRKDGTEILRGTAAVGDDNPPSELAARLAQLEQPERLVILRDIKIGMRSRRLRVRMDEHQHMGALYPFSLADKLRVITEDSPWYHSSSASTSPWKRPIIPMEMLSVLFNYSKDPQPFPVRGPVVGLFADQELRLHRGPLFVAEDYEIEREIIALSGSRRTESMWIKTRAYRPGSEEVLASMLLNSASLKDSYAHYAAEYASGA